MKLSYCILFFQFGFLTVILETNAVTWEKGPTERQNFHFDNANQFINSQIHEPGSVTFPRPKQARQTSYIPQTASPTPNPYANCSNTQQCITKGINRLAIGLDYMFLKSNPNDNFILAPINIFKTLSTVMLGAGGTTEKELLKFLNHLILGRKSPEGAREFHKEIGKLLIKVTDTDPGVKFGTNIQIAGGVFVQKGLPIKSKYVEQAKSIYKSDVIELDFANDGMNSANAVNKWVADHTNNRIKELIQPPVDPLTRLIIAGALYFNGDWEYPFFAKATKWQPFFTGSGRGDSGTIQVQLMVGQATIPYYEDKEVGYQAIGLPYKNKTVYMYVVLPRPNVSLKNLTCKFMHTDFSNIVKKSKESEVFYVMPKMQLENRINLRPTLEALGIRNLFNQAKANFSNIADTRGLFASEILHKVEMDVNEIGTTASAATATTVNRGGYINFRADRPFFLFIYNLSAQVTTFWARIQKPTPFKEVNSA